MALLSKIKSMLAAVGRFLQIPLLLLIRLYWGWQLIQTGRGKFLNLDHVVAYFTSLDIPMPKINAFMAASTECTCGLLLILGLFSRFASGALIVLLSVAYATAEKEALHSIFSNPDKFFAADPFLFLYAAVLVFAFGPGLLSLDALIGKDKGR